MIRQKLWRCAVGIALLLAGLAGAQAQLLPAPAGDSDAPADAARGQERERMRDESAAIDMALQQAEAACYQRFAVEDCLRQARRVARDARAQIRQREMVLEGAARRERAEQRLREAEERESNREPPQPNDRAVADLPSQAQRDQQAAQRVRAQQEALDANQASQAAQTRSRAEEAAQARQKKEENRQSAQQRRARVLQSQADRDAAGKQISQPLPAVP